MLVFSLLFFFFLIFFSTLWSQILSLVTPAPAQTHVWERSPPGVSQGRICSPREPPRGWREARVGDGEPVLGMARLPAATPLTWWARPPVSYVSRGEEHGRVFVSKSGIYKLRIWTKFSSSSNKAPVRVVRGFVGIWTREFGRSPSWRGIEEQVLCSELVGCFGKNVFCVSLLIYLFSTWNENCCAFFPRCKAKNGYYLHPVVILYR